MNTTSNGNGRIAYWLLGILGTVLTGGTTGWISSMHALTRAHGEKIAVLESQMTDQRYQLERIDRKLDRLLEQKKGER